MQVLSEHIHLLNLAELTGLIIIVIGIPVLDLVKFSDPNFQICHLLIFYKNLGTVINFSSKF